MWLVGALLAVAFGGSVLASPIGVGCGGLSYWDHPIFANALYAGNWLSVLPSNGFGVGVNTQNNPQFDDNGFPQSLDVGQSQKLRALIYSLHNTYGGRPSTWPNRGVLDRGLWVVTWKGHADMRLNGCTYRSGSGATGSRLDGRRVYECTSGPGWMDVSEIQQPVTALRVSMPDPYNTSRSLETELFHPEYTVRLKDANWNHLRMMDLAETNNNPQQDWADRRKPSHIFMHGVLNDRSCAPGLGAAGLTDKSTGVAYEYLVALANEAGHDLWINVPHLATNDFITKLAQLVLFGSDGVNPYTSLQANPLFAPLASNLNVYVEYSNEIWSSGGSFRQGDWAGLFTNATLNKARFNARGFCRCFFLFDQVFRGQNQRARVKRVAATFTAQTSYTTDLLNEMSMSCAMYNPPTQPDFVSPTTYFGNAIQDFIWSNRNWWNQAYSDPYWKSTLFEQRMNATFDEWMRRILSGSNQAGAGPDSTGLAGGFDFSLYTLAQNYPQGALPLIAYEGGPSLYTDNYDNNADNNTGITIFLEAMNRHPRFWEIYASHLNVAYMKGLRTHSMFVDVSSWGKYGQWGHLEYGGQNPATSVKYRLMLDFATRFAALNPIGAPVGSRPAWATADALPAARYAETYAHDITVTGGDGALAIDVIGTYNVEGLNIFTSCAQQRGVVRVAGVPASGNDFGYILLRVMDNNGDANWRVFSLINYGAPQFLVSSNFQGSALSYNLPWTATLSLLPNCNFSGWNFGAGLSRQHSAGLEDISLVWSQNMPATESDIPYALANNQYARISVGVRRDQSATVDLRGATFAFGLNRIDYHAPRQYAVFASTAGFTAGAQLFTTPRIISQLANTYFEFQLPSTAAYVLPAAGAVGAIEFRVYGFAGQYAGHKTSLMSFNIALVNYVDQPLPPALPAALYYNAWCPDPVHPPSSSSSPHSSSSLRSSSSAPGVDVDSSSASLFEPQESGAMAGSATTRFAVAVAVAVAAVALGVQWGAR